MARQPAPEARTGPRQGTREVPAKTCRSRQRNDVRELRHALARGEPIEIDINDGPAPVTCERPKNVPIAANRIRHLQGLQRLQVVTDQGHQLKGQEADTGGCIGRRGQHLPPIAPGELGEQGEAPLIRITSGQHPQNLADTGVLQCQAPQLHHPADASIMVGTRQLGAQLGEANFRHGRGGLPFTPKPDKRPYPSQNVDQNRATERLCGPGQPGCGARRV